MLYYKTFVTVVRFLIKVKKGRIQLNFKTIQFYFVKFFIKEEVIFKLKK